MPRRLSSQAEAVISALAAQPDGWRYGYELLEQLGIGAGSLYPILIRLRERDVLESRWDLDVPTGRPPRHLYRLTAEGAVLAAELADRRAMTAERPRAPRAARATSLREAW